LRATLESASKCIFYPRIQWIVIDNGSSEPGLVDYLKKQTWIDHLILRDNRNPATEHVSAMNEIVELAIGEYIMIWPEDVQFIVRGDWMIDCVEILLRYPWVGSLVLCSLRRKTIDYFWGLSRFRRWREYRNEIITHKFNFRFQRLLRSSRGFGIMTYGWTKEGIVGSGIPSLTRAGIWRALGPWLARGARPGLVDSSGGGETEMLERYKKSNLILHRALNVLPVAADIVTDNIGCKAKIRGNKRYGVYHPAYGVDDQYYEIYDQKDVEYLSKRRMPVAFEDFVKPIGYSLPLDEDGGLLKASINEFVVEDIVSV
jgi:glycosyltransferase involved in cell wall biosynthesis